MKAFSIIIPTLHRTAFVLDTLRDLVVQEYPPGFEILLIDQSTKPDQKVKDFADTYSNVNYHFITDFRGLPEARNYGAKHAKHPFLLFLDDDIACQSTLLQAHAKTLSKADVGVCAGGITEAFQLNSGIKTGYFNNFTAPPIPGFHRRANSMQYVDHAKGCNFSVKKEVYQEVQGVDEHLTNGAALYEETDFCLRVKKAGHQIMFNFEAHITHLAAETGGCRVPDIAKYIYSLSRNRSLIIKRHLPWYYQLTAHLYLLKLVAAYYKTYKNSKIWVNYRSGRKEGSNLGKLIVKNER